MRSIAMDYGEHKTAPSLDEILTDLQPGRKEKHGPCFRCGGEDRFIVFLDTGRGWCRQCDWRGDSIQLLIDRDGLTFIEAKRALGLDTERAPAAKRQATIHSLALAAAKRDYQAWQKRMFDALIEKYRELSTLCDIAEVGYRATTRKPELYTSEERSFWAHRLATLYDLVAVLEHDLSQELDIFTYKSREAERVSLWRESEARND